MTTYSDATRAAILAAAERYRAARAAQSAAIAAQRAHGLGDEYEKAKATGMAPGKGRRVRTVVTP